MQLPVWYPASFGLLYKSGGVPGKMRGSPKSPGECFFLCSSTIDLNRPPDVAPAFRKEFLRLVEYTLRFCPHHLKDKDTRMNT